MSRSFALASLFLPLSLLTSAAIGQVPSMGAPTLKPLETVLSEFRTGGDLTKAAYIFKRCSGYSFATSKLVLGSGGEQLKERGGEWLKLGLELVEYAVDAEMAVEKIRRQSPVKSKDAWNRETLEVAVEFANIYVDRMSSNYLKSGNYLVEDPWLRSEHELCREAPKRVMDSLK